MELKKKTIGSHVLGVVTNESLGAAFLVLIMVIIMVISTDTFLTGINVTNVLRQSSFYIIVALGGVCVIIVGELDLSTGSTMGIAGMTAAQLATYAHFNTVLVFIICIAIGIVVGIINGYLVGFMGLPAFIVTLGMQLMLRGLVTIISGGFPVTGLPESFTVVGTSVWFGVPSPIYIMLFLCIITWILLNRTIFGRHLYACGSNKQAAIVSGIAVKRVRLLAYVYCGALAAFSGILLTSRMMTGQVATGSGYDLLAIAGIVIGGATVGGGTGTVIGTIFGMLVISVLNNAMTLLGLNAYYTSATQGLIIVLAVMLDTGRHRLKDRLKS